MATMDKDIDIMRLPKKKQTSRGQERSTAIVLEKEHNCFRTVRPDSVHFMLELEILTSHKTRALFHTIPITFFIYYSLKKILFFIPKKFSNRDYLLLIYMFMCMITFLRRIHLSFQGTKCAFLARVWNRNRDGLSCVYLF